jgi:hypothetical protein
VPLLSSCRTLYFHFSNSPNWRERLEKEWGASSSELPALVALTHFNSFPAAWKLNDLITKKGILVNFKVP